jgi:predicted MFS family arabinose efflux permease
MPDSNPTAVIAECIEKSKVHRHRRSDAGNRAVQSCTGAALPSWGLGAALSNSVAGFIVDKAGFSAAFLFLAGCALAAFLLLWIAMPETGDPSEKGYGIIVATSSRSSRPPLL